MELKKEIINLLYEYELENDCTGEESWEKMVVGILKGLGEEG